MEIPTLLPSLGVDVLEPFDDSVESAVGMYVTDRIDDPGVVVVSIGDPTGNAAAASASTLDAPVAGGAAPVDGNSGVFSPPFFFPPLPEENELMLLTGYKR